jgi:hypothetical protein
MSSFFDVRVPGADNVEQSDGKGLWERVTELVMCKNVGISAFWFGSIFVILFSSSFSRDIEFRQVSSDVFHQYIVYRKDKLMLS